MTDLMLTESMELEVRWDTVEIVFFASEFVTSLENPGVAETPTRAESSLTPMSSVTASSAGTMGSCVPSCGFPI